MHKVKGEYFFCYENYNLRNYNDSHNLRNKNIDYTLNNQEQFFKKKHQLFRRKNLLRITTEPDSEFTCCVHVIVVDIV